MELRLPEKIGGALPSVYYVRDVADTDSLITALKTAKKVVVIGGGYIGLEVAAALTAWKLDVSLVFSEKHIMPRLFTPTIAKLYEELFEKNEVKIVKETSVSKLVPGDSGGVAKVELANGTVLDADTHRKRNLQKDEEEEEAVRLGAIHDTSAMQQKFKRKVGLTRIRDHINQLRTLHGQGGHLNIQSYHALYSGLQSAQKLLL